MACEREQSVCSGTGSYDAGEYRACLNCDPYKTGSGYQKSACLCKSELEPPTSTLVSIRLRTSGSGHINASGGDNVLEERQNILVPYGYEIYVEAVPENGIFQKFVGPGMETTENPTRIFAIENGYIEAIFVPREDMPIIEPPEKCPRGEEYDRTFFDECDAGYRKSDKAGGLLHTCRCDHRTEEEKKEAEDTNPAKMIGSVLENLPLLIGGAIAISILGLFKR